MSNDEETVRDSRGFHPAALEETRNNSNTTGTCYIGEQHCTQVKNYISQLPLETGVAKVI